MNLHPNPNGRPKGTKNKLGLSLEKRLKVLQKIILDDNAKAADRLTAIQQMTDMLADKVQVTAEGKQEMVLTLNELKPAKNIETKPIVIKSKEESILKEIETKDIAKEIPKEIAVSNTTSLSFTFEIDKNLTNEDSDATTT